ncbi:hypothetical protein DACRYDRAFT_17537 [Dacryopinax primogenitus]|uniref:Cleavage/polyadenylation specificity factor A subunit C-terminal domain-containing protein n=1 Tax=Dacryopinax primogenitus (strain DJM 731) TaxID=1858805 RepID=M5G0M8_DACPD|nr:uncharacterized protein DACRYDRAFT_17537 [Dacryopinax primogenitus]EJT99386.1 hypothetical protein DACRYDRAFT_17537 [Dacryopinax primogenitus]
MHAIRREIIPPSGISHAVSLQLIPPRKQRNSSKGRERTICQLVVARSSLLRVFDVKEEGDLREEATGDQVKLEDEEKLEDKEKLNGVNGDSKVNVTFQFRISRTYVNACFYASTSYFILATHSELTVSQAAVRTRLHLVREHRMHGFVTGLEKVRTLASGEDGMDRLLVSFKDAKIALLEWSDAIYDLSTVSLHTYERSSQVSTSEASEHRPLLRADPESRCAALLLPKDALAILPFVQRTGLDLADPARDKEREHQPYTPSYVFPLSDADDTLRHVLDFCFLPSFHTPTLAILYQPAQNWTGRLSQTKDNTSLAIVTLDLVGKGAAAGGGAGGGGAVISRTHGLPYDAFSLLPAREGSTFGGVVVLAGNSVLHVDPAGRIVGLAASGWHAQSSALRFPLWAFTAEEGETEERKLEGSRLCWAGEQQLILVGAQGWARELKVGVEGRNVSSLSAGRRLGRTSAPAVLCPVGEQSGRALKPTGRDLVWLASEAGQSVLLQVHKGEPRVEEVKPNGEEKEIEGEDMEIDADSDKNDDLADIYGDSGLPAAAASGVTAGPALPWLTLEVLDALQGHGQIADMSFALSFRSGPDRPTPKLVCSTPEGERGAWTVYENGLPIRVKRRVPAVAGTRGIWSLRVRRGDRARRGGRRERGEREWADGEERDNLIVSTDATPSPGISRTITVDSRGELQIISRLPALTLAAGVFFSHTCVMQVTPDSLHLLDGDGKELQVLKDNEGNKEASPIIKACVEDPWVVVTRENGSVALYLGDPGRRRLRYKGLPAHREKTATYAAAMIYTDYKDLLPAPHVEEPTINLRKRRASSLDAVEDALKEEEHISIEPESKRRRLRSSDEKVEEHDRREENGFGPGSGRSGRHSAREKERERVKEKERPHASRERERERSKDKDKDKDKERSRRDEKRDTKESSRRHRDSKDGREKDGKENGTSKDSRSHRHRESAEKESKEKERAGRRHESEKRKEVDQGPTVSQWLLLYNANGRLEIWSLPKMTLAFSTRLLSECRTVLDDAAAAAEPEEGADEMINIAPLQVEDVVLCPIGDDCVSLYLLVYYTEGRLAVYEATPRTATEADSTFQYRFTKVATHFADAEQHAAIRQMLPEARRLQLPSRRALIPFISDIKGGTSAVFQRGEEPCWIMASRQNGLQIIAYSSPLVYSFTPTSLFGNSGDFILYGEEGPVLMEFDEEPDTGRELSCRHIHSKRSYTSMAVDPGSNLVAAASSLKSFFLLYDDEEQPLWVPESTALFGPMAECSSLELVSPDTCQTLDGYDFAPNEFINVVKSVNLETLSSESGFKDYIAVGTSTFRGEDLAVRGATYIFEVIEVVSYPDDPLPPYRLKLLCRDEAKAPVNAICGLNGYLVSSQGFKVFVRAFEQDERLVGVAFMDAGVCVTSLTRLKNLLLIGDAKRSVSFVAFQEDPFKLRPTYVTDAAFLFDEGDFSILAADDEGTLRLFEFDPNLTGATHGNPLICETEFNGQSEHTHILAIAGRGREDPEEMQIPEAQLIFGTIDGTLGTISPVPDECFKRLQLLSGQLMRSVQHFAGLNPRAFRTVRNDLLSRPLNKGMLDYDLLHAFRELDIRRQATITKQIGTDTITILRDIRSLEEIW